MGKKFLIDNSPKVKKFKNQKIFYLLFPTFHSFFRSINVHYTHLKLLIYYYVGAYDDNTHMYYDLYSAEEYL